MWNWIVSIPDHCLFICYRATIVFQIVLHVKAKVDLQCTCMSCNMYEANIFGKFPGVSEKLILACRARWDLANGCHLDVTPVNNSDSSFCKSVSQPIQFQNSIRSVLFYCEIYISHDFAHTTWWTSTSKLNGQWVSRLTSHLGEYGCNRNNVYYHCISNF